MKKILLVLISCLMCSAVYAGDESFRAYTESGKEIILFKDRTWEYPATESYIKPKSSQKLLKGKNELYGIWINENKWKIMRNSLNDSAEFSFRHTDGDAYSLIIAERVQVSFDALKDIAFAYIKEVDPDAQIIFEENRIINGNEVLCLMISATVQSIPIIYYNYIYSGDSGSIQVVTYTGRKLFKEYADDLTSFLNGFVLLNK